MRKLGLLSKNKKNEKIVEQILLENYNKYFRLAYSHLKNEEDAADIVQNGAYKAILNSGQLKKPEFAATWIYRIMLNEIKQQYKVVKFESMEEVPETGKQDVYENFDLKEAMDQLELADQVVIRLRYFEDMKLEEIAQIQNEKLSTIKSRLYRGLRKLRVQMEEV